jgi:hypothetical protein
VVDRHFMFVLGATHVCQAGKKAFVRDHRLRLHIRMIFPLCFQSDRRRLTPSFRSYNAPHFRRSRNENSLIFNELSS